VVVLKSHYFYNRAPGRLSFYQNSRQQLREQYTLLIMSGAENSGVVAAVEQFVEAALKIAKFVKAVVDQVQDPPDRISQETGQIEDVEDILARCGSYMRDLQEILERISVEHQDSLKKKTWKAICSLQEEEDIVTLFALLHQEYISLDAHINL
jgi:hypothetical protein